MTLKKGKSIRGQSALEYFILTMAFVGAILFFWTSGAFKTATSASDDVFKWAVGVIAP